MSCHSVPDHIIASQGASKKECLRKATIRLLLDKGYEAITIRDIAHAGEIATPTLYHHYPVEPKESIVAEIIENLIVICQRTIFPSMQKQLTSIAECLDFIEQALTQLLEHDEILMLHLELMPLFKKAIFKAHVNDYFNAWVNHLHQMLSPFTKKAEQISIQLIGYVYGSLLIIRFTNNKTIVIDNLSIMIKTLIQVNQEC